MSEAAGFCLRLCCEELFNNIVFHGAKDRDDIDISCRMTVTESHVRVCFKDNGPQFSPLTWPPPQPYDTVENAQVGGLGVQMVRNYAETFDYEWAEGQNQVVFKIYKGLQSL